MCRIIAIEAAPESGSWLFTSASSAAFDAFQSASVATPIVESRYSTIVPSKSDNVYCVKLIMSRRLLKHGILKYGYSQAKKEFSSARRLKSLGVPSISVFGWGVTIKPLQRFESALVMEYFDNAVNGRQYLESVKNKPHEVDRFLAFIGNDVARIYRSGWHHSDCHLGNIVVQPSGSYRWVDSGLRKARSASQQTRLLERSLVLFESSMKNVIPDAQKKSFRNYVLANL